MFDKKTILDEMMVHIPLNTHKDPKKVLVVGCDNLHQQLSQYSCEVVYSDGFNIDGEFDIIIYFDKVSDDILPIVQRLLEPKEGIFVTLATNDIPTLQQELKKVGKDFWICMPYKFYHTTAILASKKYHPQADIILDRSDFIDAQYYNSEIHNASFVMPNNIFKALTTYAKR